VIVHPRPLSSRRVNGPGIAVRRASRPRRRVALRWFEGGLWCLALAVAAWLGYVALDRTFHDRRQSHALSEMARAAATAPPAVASLALAATRPSPEPGAPLARLEIPGAGLDVVVAAGTDARTLRRGVGHIEGTTLPGEKGNIGLAGHRDTVFRGLAKLRPADRIFLVTPGERVEYVVESLRKVAPERSDVLDPTTHPTLTLVTCYPFDFVGPAPLRFVVRAREIARAVATASAAEAVR
jgi:sortase A